MSEEHGLYDVHEIEGHRFRVWHSTETLECMSNGKWTSIPQPAQDAIRGLMGALLRSVNRGGRWTEGVCGDGAAILRDGQPVPIEEVVASLNGVDFRLTVEREACARIVDAVIWSDAGYQRRHPQACLQEASAAIRARASDDR